MKNNRILTGLAVLALTIGLLGCGSGGGTKPQVDTAADATEAGWTRFGGAKYTDALTEFNRAIGLDASYADAYLGAGWAHLRSQHASDAEGRFGVGLGLAQLDPVVADFQAGLAIAHFGQEELDEAIVAVDACLALQPQYSFSRLTSVNRLDLLAIKANALFLKGGDANLEASAVLVHQIVSSINLDPALQSSWTVDGVSYDTFTEALLRALEVVDASVS